LNAEQASSRRIGQVVADLYEIRHVHKNGGMGLVYRVHHRGWGVDLAMKCPRPRLFRSEKLKVLFEREAETWVRLGLHPNIVSCYYVRRLEGIPRIFAEYVEGGTLEDWIRQGRLYTGEPPEVLARLLDVAIQFAWGQHYAHEQGLVHLDVKPANVLMTPTGQAKVTDFGLARARLAVGEVPIPCPDADEESFLVSSGGMTPAYCSPEQAARQPVSRRTDIWSWAVSVLEMFCRGVPWRSGVRAAQTLEGLLRDKKQTAHIPLPLAVAQILRRCLQHDPAARPRDMLEITTALEEVYQQQTGHAYPRVYPQATELLAYNLNNRAVSLLDLGQRREAETLWREALHIEPHHPESTSNLALLHWREGRLTDEDVLRQLKRVEVAYTGDWLPPCLLAQFHLERGALDEALGVMQRVRQEHPQQGEVSALGGRIDRLVTDIWRPVRVFAGYGAHTSAIHTLALNREGTRVVVGDGVGVLKWWDIERGDCLQTIPAHKGAVRSVVLSASRPLALSGGEDGLLKLWELHRGQCPRTFVGHEGAVNAVALARNQRSALSGGQDGTVRLWDLRTGQCLHTLAGQAGQVRAVTLLPGGRHAVSAGGDAHVGGHRDYTLRVWDLRTGRCVRILAGHERPVTALALRPGTRQVLSASADGTLRLWDLKSGEVVRTLQADPQGLRVACWAGPRLILVGGESRALKLWQVDTGRCLLTLGGQHEVQALAVTADGRQAVSGGHREVKVWRLGPDLASPIRLSRVVASEQAQQASQVYVQSLTQARQALAQGELATAARRVRQARTQPGYNRRPEALDLWGELYLRLRRKSLNAAWEEKTLTGHRASVTAARLSSDGSLAVSGSIDRTLRLWTVPEGESLRTFKGHQGKVTSVCWSPDGRSLLSASKDGALCLWDVESGQCLQTCKGDQEAVCDIALTADQRYALSVSRDGTLRWWDLAGGRCVRSVPAHDVGGSTLSLGREEQYALTGGLDGTVKLWKVATGECLRSLPLCNEPISQCLLRTDLARGIAAASKMLILYDLESGQVLRKYRGHRDRVSSLSWSADGLHLLSASWDRTARLWKLATGRCVHTLVGHADKVLTTSLSPDGRWALTGSADQSLKLWFLDWELENAPLADDEGIRPHLETFLTLHTPYAEALPRLWRTNRHVTRAFSRAGVPHWSKKDFEKLLYTLGCVGYGHMAADDIRRQLEKLAASWRGLPSRLG
jgi:WD40 repeat protein/serine/threonine protein kinase